MLRDGEDSKIDSNRNVLVGMHTLNTLESVEKRPFSMDGCRPR